MENLNKIGTTFQGLGIDSKVPSPMKSWMPWLQSLTNNRNYKQIIKKAYFWTLDDEVSMRKILDYGSDGCINNFSDRMLAVLQEAPYSQIYRLATQEDKLTTVHGFS